MRGIAMVEEVIAWNHGLQTRVEMTRDALTVSNFPLTWPYFYDKCLDQRCVLLTYGFHPRQQCSRRNYSRTPADFLVKEELAKAHGKHFASQPRGGLEETNCVLLYVEPFQERIYGHISPVRRYRNVMFLTSGGP